MPRAIRMPTLPRGPRCDFVENLFVYLRRANRPTLQAISDRLRERNDLAGTASKETIRKMLRGETVPQRWENAEAVFLVLCELAGVVPTDLVGDEGFDLLTHLEQYHELWNRALDAPAVQSVSAFDDEPPF